MKRRHCSKCGSTAHDIRYHRRKRRNPSGATSEGALMKGARRMSRNFHGEGKGDLIELSEEERKLPKYLIPLGRMPRLEYEPPSRSERGEYRWVHEAGDEGKLFKTGAHKPILAADPKTGKPVIVPHGSGMRFSSRRGLVG